MDVCDLSGLSHCGTQSQYKRVLEARPEDLSIKRVPDGARLTVRIAVCPLQQLEITPSAGNSIEIKPAIRTHASNPAYVLTGVFALGHG